MTRARNLSLASRSSSCKAARLSLQKRIEPGCGQTSNRIDSRILCVQTFEHLSQSLLVQFNSIDFLNEMTVFSRSVFVARQTYSNQFLFDAVMDEINT